MKEHGLFINGEWVAPSTGQVFESINPANGKVLARFVQATIEDVKKAVEVAQQSFPAWKDF